MNSSINLRLFDRFRHVDRWMRMGRVSGMMYPDIERSKPLTPDGAMSLKFQSFHREIILAILYMNQAGMIQQDIADEIHVSKSTLSEMINRLEEGDYLERTSDSSDRRVTLVVLTEKGAKRAEEVIEERAGMMERWFRNLEDSDKVELIRLLDKLLGEESGDCI